jgi:hypothetical protein
MDGQTPERHRRMMVPPEPLSPRGYPGALVDQSSRLPPSRALAGRPVHAPPWPLEARRPIPMAAGLPRPCRRAQQEPALRAAEARSREWERSEARQSVKMMEATRPAAKAQTAQRE